MRLFLAIPLAEAVVEELSAVQARLQRSGDGLRWTAAESWHITLQFLGNTSAEQYACVVARLREVRMTPVPIALAGLSCFERAGVFFADVRLTPELMQLQERVTAATRPCGFVAEARAYQPHVTLARNKGRGEPRGLHALKAKIGRPQRFTRFVAEEFLLYESFLGGAGSRYEVRERFALSQ